MLTLAPEYFETNAEQFVVHEPMSAAIGVHAIIGANNSGKTRLLLSLATATCFHRTTPRQLDNIIPNFRTTLRDIYQRRVQRWDEPEILVAWPRGTRSVALKSTNEFVMSALGEVSFDASNLNRSVPVRTIRHVETNRYFAASANISSLGTLDTLPSVVSFLENRKAEANDAIFREIQDEFNVITDGLSFDIRMLADQNLERAVYIRENKKSELRPLRDCGDGLRDLIMIIANCVVYHDADLLLDEPGLRLHSRSQRRLLSFLVADARRHGRVTYLTTHDEALISSPTIDGRYFVKRNHQEMTEVRGLPPGAEIWKALRELGAEPSRILGTTGIIVPEGPSDVEVISAVLDVLKSEMPIAGDFLAEHLGGDGNIVTAHKQVFAVLRRAMPFGDIAVVLDKTGSAVAKDRAEFKDYCKANAISFAELKKGDLEDYYPDELVIRFVQSVFPDADVSELHTTISGKVGLARFEALSKLKVNNRLKNKRVISAFVSALDPAVLRIELADLINEVRELVTAARAATERTVGLSG